MPVGTDVEEPCSAHCCWTVGSLQEVKISTSMDRIDLDIRCWALDLLRRQEAVGDEVS